MKRKNEPLYSLPSPVYTQGTDLVICSGELRRDRKSDALSCFLTVQSLSGRSPESVSVLLTLFDEAGSQLGESIVFHYTDLDLKRGSIFGEKTEIPIPDSDAKSFSVCVTEITEKDGTPVAFAESDAVPLTGRQTLEEAYGEEELAEQFRIRYGEDCRYACSEERDLWYCACGAINSQSEKACYRCGRQKKAMAVVNPDSLRAEAGTRQRERDLGELAPAPKETKAPRKYRFLLFLLPVIFVAVLAIAAVPGAVQREQKYRSATEALQTGDLDTAEKIFSEIPAYRDSDRLATRQIPYLRALDILEAAKRADLSALSDVGLSEADVTDDTTVSMLLYSAAAKAFSSLGDYEDCAKLAEECQDGVDAEVARLEAEALALKQADYDHAVELLASGSYSEAAEAFKSLSGFSDSDAMATECRYQKALALFHFLCGYDVSRISARIAMGPDSYSIFSMPNSEALRLGSGCIAELRDACGGDPVDVRMEDEPSGDLLSLKDALTDFFLSLDGYADSAEYPARIEEETDYTKEFFMLCEAGDLYGAYQWISAYEGAFPEREFWLQQLNDYLPYCGVWALASGDPTLLPRTLGQQFEGMYVMSRALLTKDSLTLRLSCGDNNALTFDLPVEYGDNGEIRFINRELFSGNYMVYINALGHLTYERYDGDWNRMGASEYERAG